MVWIAGVNVRLNPLSPIIQRFSGKNVPSRFRVQGWDPVLILSQIVVLQTLHYCALALSMTLLFVQFSGRLPTLDDVFDWNQLIEPVPFARIHALESSFVPVDPVQAQGDAAFVHFFNTPYWTILHIIAWVLTGMQNAVVMYFVVRQPRQILDFSSTLFFIHFVLTWVYSGALPTSFVFWTTYLSVAILQTVLAEHLCISREMRDGFDPAAIYSLPTHGSEAESHEMEIRKGPE